MAATTILPRIAALALLLAALGSGSAGAVDGAVTGTAHYRERIALPPTALLEATLEDVSRADAPAAILGQTQVAPVGQVPIRFEIAYDPAAIDPTHSYAVRGRILVEGRLWLTTTEAHLVLTRGHGEQVDLLLRPAGQAAASVASSPLGELPATFAGDLPCADCPGIRYQLDLFPDQAFYLRRTYLDRGPDNVVDDIGSFLVAADGKTLTLHGGREAPLQLAIQGPERLTQLDIEGRAIVSDLSYDLTRQAAFAPIEPRLTLRGMYRYMADAGLLTECLSRQRLPVAQEGDNAALERAYVEARRQPGEELLVEVAGRIARRPRIEGEGQVPTLVVERLIGVWPGETCGARFDTAPLENSYWKLTRLAGEPVTLGPEQREPHLILRPGEQRLDGYGGCNRFTGPYRVEGQALALGPIASTMMACADGMTIEDAFFQALSQVKAWKIVGEHLELLDAGGTLLARFERRLMP